MLAIDLTGKRALVAGVADDAGFGFAISKALAEAGASVCVGTWPPALNIIETLIRRGTIDESRKHSRAGMLEYETIHPLNAAYAPLAASLERVRSPISPASAPYPDTAAGCPPPRRRWRAIHGRWRSRRVASSASA